MSEQQPVWAGETQHLPAVRSAGHLTLVREPERADTDVVGGALSGLGTCLRVLCVGTGVFMVAGTLWFAIHSNHPSGSQSGNQVTTTAVRPAVATPAPTPPAPVTTSPQCWMFCTSGPGVAG